MQHSRNAGWAEMARLLDLPDSQTLQILASFCEVVLRIQCMLPGLQESKFWRQGLGMSSQQPIEEFRPDVLRATRGAHSELRWVFGNTLCLYPYLLTPWHYSPDGHKPLLIRFHSLILVHLRSRWPTCCHNTVSNQPDSTTRAIW
jgi:hypothetical protein